jgi:hypothetical protein
MVYFQTKKSKFGKILAGPARCKMLVFFGHLGYVFYAQMLYFKTIWYILWPFGTFCGHLVHLNRFGMLCRKKSGSPGRIVVQGCFTFVHQVWFFLAGKRVSCLQD